MSEVSWSVWDKNEHENVVVICTNHNRYVHYKEKIERSGNLEVGYYVKICDECGAESKGWD